MKLETVKLFHCFPKQEDLSPPQQSYFLEFSLLNSNHWSNPSSTHAVHRIRTCKPFTANDFQDRSLTTRTYGFSTRSHKPPTIYSESFGTSQRFVPYLGCTLFSQSSASTFLRCFQIFSDQASYFFIVLWVPHFSFCILFHWQGLSRDFMPRRYGRICEPKHIFTIFSFCRFTGLHGLNSNPDNEMKNNYTVCSYNHQNSLAF